MNEEELYSRLTAILEAIDPEEYPEIAEALQRNVGSDGEVYDDAFSIAYELHGADGAKPLPELVAVFMKDVYLAEIERGNFAAANDLGSLYYTGRIGEQSYEKALHYYSIAADGGDRQAQENLGYCYYYGRNCEVDYKKAFHYFALGAFDGHLNSLYKIADMYRYGYYVAKNPAEAFRIYRHCYDTLTERAAELVGADIMLRMGDCYFEGIGTELDYQKAQRFYQQAEQLFYKKLLRGDYFIRNNWEKSIRRQEEARVRLREELPDLSWSQQG